MQDVLLDELLNKLSTGYGKERASAAIKLGSKWDSRVLHALIVALNEEQDLEVRASIIHALANQHNQEALEPLISLLGHTQEYSLIAVIISALGRLRDNRALNYILPYLSHTDDRIRRNATAALGNLADKRAIYPLINLLLRDKDSDVRMFAASALGNLKTNDAVQPLLQALEYNEDTAEEEMGEVRAEILFALGKIGNYAALQPILYRLKDSDSIVREAAADALGYLKDRSAVTPLTEIVADQEEAYNVRIRAAETLGYLGDDSQAVIKTLVSVLHEQQMYNGWKLGTNAAESLSKLGEKGKQALIEASHSENEAVRKLALNILNR
ncbi:MAG: HEAT repeat domain-containing protein [Chloroflexi bacterium]|uniref:HEAT repeat domain-containing protein n=1 Tax=Candidatus Chlorohelix allophototropha TaxID=3003348 RepID=A0A8T7MA42_9CHLR|nr:HEAT repeat domain-containing protein [Chloroflexota bacterium]WJW68827.1 HEAT repeat domain-containing protein [Chloroflexota bacterium L227-S17]